nr:predicted protein [Mycena chlorophos]
MGSQHVFGAAQHFFKSISTLTDITIEYPPPSAFCALLRAFETDKEVLPNLEHMDIRCAAIDQGIVSECASAFTGRPQLRSLRIMFDRVEGLDSLKFGGEFMQLLRQLKQGGMYVYVGTEMESVV